jgi:hypothetical protein
MIYGPCANEYHDNAINTGNHVKMMMALSDTEDAPTRRAASATLAILAHIDIDNERNAIGEYLMKEDHGLGIVVRLLKDDDIETIVRGVELVRCMFHNEGLATRMCAKEPELVLAMKKILTAVKHPGIVQSTVMVLKMLQSYDIVI